VLLQNYLTYLPVLAYCSNMMFFAFLNWVIWYTGIGTS